MSNYLTEYYFNKHQMLEKRLKELTEQLVFLNEQKKKPTAAQRAILKQADELLGKKNLTPEQSKILAQATIIQRDLSSEPLKGKAPPTVENSKGVQPTSGSPIGVAPDGYEIYQTGDGPTIKQPLLDIHGKPLNLNNVNFDVPKHIRTLEDILDDMEGRGKRIRLSPKFSPESGSFAAPQSIKDILDPDTGFIKDDRPKVLSHYEIDPNTGKPKPVMTKTGMSSYRTLEKLINAKDAVDWKGPFGSPFDARIDVSSDKQIRLKDFYNSGKVGPEVTQIRTISGNPVVPDSTSTIAPSDKLNFDTLDNSGANAKSTPKPPSPESLSNAQVIPPDADLSKLPPSPETPLVKIEEPKAPTVGDKITKLTKTGLEGVEGSAKKVASAVSTQFPTPIKSYPKEIAKEAGGAIKGLFTLPGVAGLGGAIAAGYGLEKAAEATGIESLKSNYVKLPVEFAAGAATDVATSQIMKQGLKSLGTRAALGSIGGGAAAGLAVGAAAALGYEAGKAISGIEVDEKGTTVSDVMGKGIYDVFGKVTGQGTSAKQLNTKATGIAGGNVAVKAQREREDQEEEERLKKFKEFFGSAQPTGETANV